MSREIRAEYFQSLVSYCKRKLQNQIPQLKIQNPMNNFKLKTITIKLNL